jgi:A/G-specific adenine glycosylase
MTSVSPAQTSDRDPALSAILAWWEEHHRELPWRETRDPYAVWVAEVMSAQTSVLRAVSAWEAWMARWPTVDSLARASLGDVLAQWQGLGYPRRARDLHRSAQLIAADGWPTQLTDLPGVGAYVSAAIRCFALEEPVLPRDVNVNRVMARRFGAGVDITADPWRAGQAVMEFGQRVCTVRPDCAACPASDGCPGPGPDEARERAKRRQKPYAGSLRQRRGQLLARVLAEGSIPIDAVDALGAEARIAADSLVTDGLLRRDGERLRPPG